VRIELVSKVFGLEGEILIFPDIISFLYVPFSINILIFSPGYLGNLVNWFQIPEEEK